MRYKAVLLAILSLFLLAGCARKDNSNTMMDGRKALEDGSYEVAMNKLSDVLEENDENTEARQLYIQAFRMNSAQKYEEKGNYKQAIEEIQQLIKEKGGSSQVNDEARKLLKRLEKDYEKSNKDQEIRKENAKKSAESYKKVVEDEAMQQHYAAVQRYQREQQRQAAIRQQQALKQQQLQLQQQQNQGSQNANQQGGQANQGAGVQRPQQGQYNRVPQQNYGARKRQ